MEFSSLVHNLPGFASAGHVEQVLPIVAGLIAASLVVSFVAGMIKKAIGLAIIGILVKVFVFGSTENLPSWDELNLSIQRGDIRVIEEAVKNGANINYQPIGKEGRLGNTLLMSAIGMGKYDTAIKLLQLGADPCIRNGIGQTALEMLAPGTQKTMPELAARLTNCH